MNIFFIGLGKAGLPIAEAISEHHIVTGYDVLPKTSDKITIIDDLAVNGADLIFIAVPTLLELNYDGSTSSQHVEAKDLNYGPVLDVLDRLKPIVHHGQVVVLISTCLPGTVRRWFADFEKPGVCLLHNPCFVGMSTVVDDFRNPEFILIGTRSGEANAATQRLVDCYKSLIVGAEEKCQVTSWTEAETIQTMYNAFIAFKLTFVNMIQEVAQELGDVDVDMVTETLCRGHRRLLSPAFMTAGLGFSEGRPQDLMALSNFACTANLSYDLFGAIIQAREEQARSLAMFIADRAETANLHDIIILGKSYKPGIPYTEGSYAVLVGHYLYDEGFHVHFDDPLTGDVAPEIRAVYFQAHPGRCDFPFVADSVIVDPWRQCPCIDDCDVYYYGDTRDD